MIDTAAPPSSFGHMMLVADSPGSAGSRASLHSPSSHASSSVSSLSPTAGIAAKWDQETLKLFATLNHLRSSRSLEDRMLLFEGEYHGDAVFVRDIALKEADAFDGNIMNLQHTVEHVQSLSHPCLTGIVMAQVLAKEERLVVLSQRAVESVADKIHKSRSLYYEETLTREDAIDIALAVCEAGEYLHNHGIWQLNLKPSSVLVFPWSDSPFKLSESCMHPMLRGASLARRPPPAPDCTVPSVSRTAGLHSSVSSLGHVSRANATINHTFPMGSSLAESFGSENPEYLAVEQLAGEENITPKADVFSFGMLLWQLLHLRAAYPKGWGPLMIHKSLQAGNRPHLDTSLVGMDSPLRRIIELCWATDPSLRPTFSEVRRMLLIARQVHFHSNRSSSHVNYSSQVMQPIQLRERNPRGSEGSLTVEIGEYDLPSHEEPAYSSSRPYARSSGHGASDPALDPTMASSSDEADPDENNDTTNNSECASGKYQPESMSPSPISLTDCPVTSSTVFTVGQKVSAWLPQTRQYTVSTVRAIDHEKALFAIAKPSRRMQYSVPKSPVPGRGRGEHYDVHFQQHHHHHHQEPDLVWVDEHNLVAHCL